LNRNMIIKLLDAFVMTILMIVEMGYWVTGNKLHEIFGVSLLILFIVHNTLNIRWYKTIFKGKMNVRRILKITSNRRKRSV
jgi:hypothetical protein